MAQWFDAWQVKRGKAIKKSSREAVRWRFHRITDFRMHWSYQRHRENKCCRSTLQPPADFATNPRRCQAEGLLREGVVQDILAESFGQQLLPAGEGCPVPTDCFQQPATWGTGKTAGGDMFVTWYIIFVFLDKCKPITKTVKHKSKHRGNRG